MTAPLAQLAECNRKAAVTFLGLQLQLGTQILNVSYTFAVVNLPQEMYTRYRA